MRPDFFRIVPRAVIGFCRPSPLLWSRTITWRRDLCCHSDSSNCSAHGYCLSTQTGYKLWSPPTKRQADSQNALSLLFYLLNPAFSQLHFGFYLFYRLSPSIMDWQSLLTQIKLRHEALVAIQTRLVHLTPIELSEMRLLLTQSPRQSTDKSNKSESKRTMS